MDKRDYDYPEYICKHCVDHSETYDGQFVCNSAFGVISCNRVIERLRLEACQIYVDYVLEACEGMGSSGSRLFSDAKRVELHNNILKAFGLSREDRYKIQHLSDDLSCYKFNGEQLKEMIEKELEQGE